MIYCIIMLEWVTLTFIRLVELFIVLFFCHYITRIKLYVSLLRISAKLDIDDVWPSSRCQDNAEQTCIEDEKRQRSDCTVVQ